MAAETPSRPEYTLDDDFVGRCVGVPSELMAAILATSPLRVHRVKVYGRDHPTPREVAWHADPGLVYRYSGLTHEPAPWTGPLARIRDALREVVGANFNCVLVNHYRTGRDGMGYHSDDEPVFGDRPVIASVSLGATRRFAFRAKRPAADGGRRSSERIDLVDGSLLVMRGRSQVDWQHALPKTTRSIGPRLNLTYRVYDVEAVPDSWRR